MSPQRATLVISTRRAALLAAVALVITIPRPGRAFAQTLWPFGQPPAAPLRIQPPSAAPTGVQPPSEVQTVALPPDADPAYSTPVDLDGDDRLWLDDPARRRDPTGEPAGTLTINTKLRKLYLSLGDGQAIEYGIGVGRQGFAWKGVAEIGRKAYWPGWTPPPEMLARSPELPPPSRRQPRQSARGARALSLPGQQGHVVPHPRHQRAEIDRPRRIVGLHPHAQRRRDRPLRAGGEGHEGGGAVGPETAPRRVAAVRVTAGAAISDCADKLTPNAPPRTVESRWADNGKKSRITPPGRPGRPDDAAVLSAPLSDALRHADHVTRDEVAIADRAAAAAERGSRSCRPPFLRRRVRHPPPERRAVTDGAAPNIERRGDDRADRAVSGGVARPGAYAAGAPLQTRLPEMMSQLP